MIDSMKHLKTEKVETAQDESHSTEFETLFQEHWGRVYRLLQRLVGDPAEAEDLALETFLRLYNQRSRQEDGFNPGGWLYRVATNLGLHSIRSWKRRDHYEMTAGKFALEDSRDEGPAEIHAQDEERQQVRRVLAKMNQKQSQILILRYSGLSYKEIASTLHLASASIGPLLVRAEREFEKQYRALAQEESWKNT
jgi:RNA polymerase sigma-70 factor (ECF subfamily)